MFSYTNKTLEDSEFAAFFHPRGVAVAVSMRDPDVRALAAAAAYARARGGGAARQATRGAP